MNCRLFLLAVLAASLSSGCLTHRYGDATLQENSDALSITRDRLSLKPIPLDRAATHTLHVRDLPLPIYPTHLRIPLTPTEADLRRNFPWENVQLRIEFRAPNGAAFYSNKVSLATAERGRSPGTYHQLELQLRQPDSGPWRAPENMPHYTSYDVVVAVPGPSKNPKQRVILYGDTYVK